MADGEQAPALGRPEAGEATLVLPPNTKEADAGFSLPRALAGKPLGLLQAGSGGLV